MSTAVNRQSSHAVIATWSDIALGAADEIIAALYHSARGCFTAPSGKTNQHRF
jgi:hypothetical protein